MKFVNESYFKIMFRKGLFFRKQKNPNKIHSDESFVSHSTKQKELETPDVETYDYDSNFDDCDESGIDYDDNRNSHFSSANKGKYFSCVNFNRQIFFTEANTKCKIFFIWIMEYAYLDLRLSVSNTV